MSKPKSILEFIRSSSNIAPTPVQSIILKMAVGESLDNKIPYVEITPKLGGKALYFTEQGYISYLEVHGAFKKASKDRKLFHVEMGRVSGKSLLLCWVNSYQVYCDFVLSTSSSYVTYSPSKDQSIILSRIFNFTYNSLVPPAQKLTSTTSRKFHNSHSTEDFSSYHNKVCGVHFKDVFWDEVRLMNPGNSWPLHSESMSHVTSFSGFSRTQSKPFDDLLEKPFVTHMSIPTWHVRSDLDQVTTSYAYSGGIFT
jgi:hypothetical protein